MQNIEKGANLHDETITLGDPAEHDTVLIEAADQIRLLADAHPLAELTNNPAQEVPDLDPIEEFEVVLAGPDDIAFMQPTSAANLLAEILPTVAEGVDVTALADIGRSDLATDPIPTVVASQGKEVPAQVLVVKLEPTAPSQTALQHRKAPQPKKWSLRHIVVPLAVVATAVCLALFPGVQQHAVSLLEQLGFADVAYVLPLWPPQDLPLIPQVLEAPPPMSWEPPSWTHCEAFDAENCSAAALVQALAQAAGPEKYVAAGVLSNCANQHGYEGAHRGVPAVVAALVRGLKLQSDVPGASDAAATVEALQSLLPGLTNAIDVAAATEHLVRLLENEAEDVRNAAAFN
jgi:hypothetical protein